MNEEVNNEMIEQTTEQKPKSRRGGYRPGAGRPNVRKSCRSIGIRIPQDIADIIDAQPNRSAFIIEAIRAHARALGIVAEPTQAY